MKKINIILLILFLSHYCRIHSMIRENFKNTPIKNNTEHICTSCKKLYKTLGSLNKHKRQVHEIPSSCVCLQCHKFFVSQQTLDRHARQFQHNQKISLNKPIQTVSTKPIKNEEVHLCVSCKKSFKTLSSLNKHKRDFHEPTHFVCSRCNTFFVSQNNLDKHIENFHIKGSYSQTSKPRKFIIQSTPYLKLLPYTTQQTTASIIFPQINAQKFVPPLQLSFEHPIEEEFLFDFNINDQESLFFDTTSQ